MGESRIVAHLVKCYYCKREYFVPTAELDKYTAMLEDLAKEYCFHEYQEELKRFSVASNDET